MNADKARLLLKKVLALFDNLSDQGTMSALERDLLLSYLRDLYAEISSPQATFASTRDVNEPASLPVDKPVQDLPVPPKITTKPSTWHEPPEQKVPEPVHTYVERVIPPLKQIKVEPVTEITEKKVPAAESIPSIVAESGTKDKSLRALFEFKEIGELAEKLKLQPIERIEYGMGINERILTINELFNGDSELFKKTVDYLNNLQDFADARDYLLAGVAAKNNWAEEMRKNKASYFIELLRRRYASNA